MRGEAEEKKRKKRIHIKGMANTHLDVAVDLQRSVHPPILHGEETRVKKEPGKRAK
jgi:hypothetical protein